MTGASRGIGAATARLFAEQGANVTICGRRLEPLQRVAEEINSGKGGRCLAISTDVSDEEAIKNLVAQTVETYGRIDSIVNNAVLMVPDMLATHSTKRWRQNFIVSLDGALFLMREAYPELKKNNGSIVNVASLCGLAGSVATAGYSAAKAAMIQLTRNAAIEWAPHVRCNAIAPGVFMTPATRQVITDEAAEKATAKSLPLKRIGDPKECAQAILFMASDESSFITGTCLPVDGGRMAELNTGTASWDD